MLTSKKSQPLAQPLTLNISQLHFNGFYYNAYVSCYSLDGGRRLEAVRRAGGGWDGVGGGAWALKSGPPAEPQSAIQLHARAEEHAEHFTAIGVGSCHSQAEVPVVAGAGEDGP